MTSGLINLVRAVSVDTHGVGNGVERLSLRRSLSTPRAWTVVPFPRWIYILARIPPASALPAFDAPGPSVDPGSPAERLAADPDLAARTRRRAPGSGDGSAVEAFLEDEAAVEAVREEARAEAERRAEEWGLGDVLRDREPTREDPSAD